MKARKIVAWALALFFAAALAGCLFAPPDGHERPETTPEAASQREYLAALKAAGNFIIGEAELEQQISRLLNPQTAGRGIAPAGQTAITGSKKLPVTSRRMPVQTAYARSAEGGQAPAEAEVYVFSTENADGVEGYVLASTDMRIGSILAVVDGGPLEGQAEWFTDIIFAGLAGYIDYTLDLYDGISEAELPQLLDNAAPPQATGSRSVGSGSATLAVPGKGLMHHWYPDAPNVTGAYYSWTDGVECQTPQWHQLWPHNYVVRSSHGGAYDDYYTGCGPVALAQLMAYYGHPLKCALDVPVANLDININNRPYHWDEMRQINGYFYKESPGTEAELDIAVLMYEIGKRAKAMYFEKKTVNGVTTGPSTSTGDPGLITALRAMGYVTPDDFSPYNFSDVQNSLMAQPRGQPVLMAGASDMTNQATGTVQRVGHAWLIDGVRKMTYTEVLASNYTDPKGITSYSWTWYNADFVRCNVGWPNSGINAWYFSGLFDFNYQSVPRSAVNNYYRYGLRILPNVQPQ